MEVCLLPKSCTKSSHLATPYNHKPISKSTAIRQPGHAQTNAQRRSRGRDGWTIPWNLRTNHVTIRCCTLRSQSGDVELGRTQLGQSVSLPNPPSTELGGVAQPLQHGPLLRPHKLIVIPLFLSSAPQNIHARVLVFSLLQLPRSR